MIWSKLSGKEGMKDLPQAEVDSRYQVQNAWDRMMQEEEWANQKKAHELSLDQQASALEAKDILDMLNKEDPEMRELNRRRMLQRQGFDGNLTEEDLEFLSTPK